MKTAPSDILPVYAIVGSEWFLRAQRLREVLDHVSAAPDSLGPTRIDGASADLAEVLDELRTPSLLGERRVVVVDDADEFISAHRTVLERYAQSPAPGGTLILLCNTLPSRTRLYRAIEQTGRIIACSAPARGALVDWICRWAQGQYGKRVDRETAMRLREQVGDSLAALDAELAKLAAYTDARPEILVADINALTGHHREEKIFGVTDAMAAGNASAALTHWEQVLETDRAAPARAIAGLAWGVRRLLNARREWERGTKIFALAKQMFMDPDVLQRRLSTVSSEELEVQLRDLLDADLAVKTGSSTVETVVTNFIVRHSSGRVEPARAISGGRR